MTYPKTIEEYISVKGLTKLFIVWLNISRYFISTQIFITIKVCKPQRKNAEV